MSYIQQQIEEIKELQDQLAAAEWRAQVQAAIDVTLSALTNNKKIFFAGNGGSAADAQHMAGEFVSRFEFDRPGLPGVALTVDTSILTACGNDYGFDNVFARQVQALGMPGDVIWVYTTSGKSTNIIKAVEQAKKMEIKVIAFCGQYTSLLESMSDVIISINSTRTPRIQEWHLISGHIICGAIENEIFS